MHFEIILFGPHEPPVIVPGVPLKTVLDTLIASDIKRKTENIIMALKIWMIYKSPTEKLPTMERFTSVGSKPTQPKLSDMKKFTSQDHEPPTSKLSSLKRFVTVENLNDENASLNEKSLPILKEESDKYRTNEYQKLRENYVRIRLRDLIVPLPTIVEEVEEEEEEAAEEGERASLSEKRQIDIRALESVAEGNEKRPRRWWQRSLRSLRPRRRSLLGSAPASIPTTGDATSFSWWRTLLLSCCCAVADAQ